MTESIYLIVLENGSYFGGWRLGKPVTTTDLSRAKIYTKLPDILEDTHKLQELGLEPSLERKTVDKFIETIQEK